MIFEMYDQCDQDRVQGLLLIVNGECPERRVGEDHVEE